MAMTLNLSYKEFWYLSALLKENKDLITTMINSDIPETIKDALHNELDIIMYINDKMTKLIYKGAEIDAEKY